LTDTSDAKRRDVAVIAGYMLVPSPEANRALVSEALAEAAAGRLRPIIGQRFAMSKAADAHAAIEARLTVGKTILLPEP
jgi:NADPH:quinone reductase